MRGRLQVNAFGVAIEAASEPNDTHGSAICLLTFSSDIRKNTTPTRVLVLLHQVEDRVFRGRCRRSFATSASVLPGTASARRS